MFDCHYDLLTYIYMRKNDVSEIKEYCKEVFTKDNISGGIFNLFYMSIKEMEEEINIPKEDINIVENLKVVNKLIKEEDILPKGIKSIIGIEGLDYLEKIEDIDTLYDLGLRSTNIVWSNDNKFGGGVRGDKRLGLTDLGEKLVRKLVQKGIAIDLSHANTRTFETIISLCKRLKDDGLDPIVFASHSNCMALCDVARNLTDEQILEIKELDGIIGLVAYKPFVSIGEPLENKEYYEEKYVEHITHLQKLTGSIDYIAASTDDMRNYNRKLKYYNSTSIYEHKEVGKRLKELLRVKGYSKGEIEKILHKNIEDKILRRIGK